MKTKATLLALATALCATTAFAGADFTAPPVNFDAGQGSHTVTMTGKMTTMGFSMDIPSLTVASVVKPTSQAEFCAEVKSQQYEGMQQDITTCTFNGNSGTLAGTMNIGGSVSKFTYNYVFR